MEIKTDAEAINDAIEYLYSKGGYPSEWKIPDNLHETDSFISFNNKTGDLRNDINSGYTLRYINQTDPTKSPYYCLRIHVFSLNQNFYGYGSMRQSNALKLTESDRKRLLFEKEQRKKEELQRKLFEKQENEKIQEWGQNQIYAKISVARPINPLNKYIISHGLSDWASSLKEPLLNFGDKLESVKRWGAFEDEKGNIIVPIYNTQDEAVNLQTIYYDKNKQDKNGNPSPGFSKRFLKNVQMKERFAQIKSEANSDDLVYVCEGWATGMAISLNSEKNVLCSMSCANLESTVEYARTKYKKIVLVADNDRNEYLSYDEMYITKEKAMNTNIDELNIPESEKHAWKALSDCVVIPPNPHTDANDYWTSGQNLRTILEVGKYYASNNKLSR